MRSFFLLAVGLLAPAALAVAPPGPGAPTGVPELPGFRALGPGQNVEPARLYGVIDGGAELYLEYGFRELMLREFQRDELRLAVQLYDLGHPLSAWGLARRLWPEGGQALGLGSESLALPPAHCLLRQDRYFVRVEPLAGRLTVEDCRAALAPVAAVLPGPVGQPAVLGLLPEAGRVPGSLGYARKSHLGLAALEEVLHADYQPEGGPAHQAFVFLSWPDRPADEIWAGLGKRWKPVPHPALEVLGRDVPYRGPVRVTRTPRGLCGVVLPAGPEAESRALEALERLVAHLAIGR
jgi:hypothetical protein